MHPAWEIRTGRLILRPVAAGDLADLRELKADPLAFAMLLGGLRTPEQSARELADDIAFWARRGFGMWTARDARTGAFVGIAGLMERPDGRGVALRFALCRGAQGVGYGSEAAGAVLRFAHDTAGLPRVVAVAREDNFGSRQVLGAIGMRLQERFMQDGTPKLLFVSERQNNGA
jgi:RimJ/RimL family protein N-acetyltransferase